MEGTIIRSMMIKTPSAVGEAIAVRRKTLKMTQEDVGDAVGLSRRAINAIENGKSMPKISTLLAICQVLGIDFYLEPRS